MLMARKIYVDMTGASVGYLKQFMCSHGDILLRSSESAVVPHDTANISQSQQQVCFFQQYYVSPRFSR